MGEFVAGLAPKEIRAVAFGDVIGEAAQPLEWWRSVMGGSSQIDQ
jgi:hypothetical protein